VQSTSSESPTSSTDYNALVQAYLNATNAISPEDKAVAAAKKKLKTDGAARPKTP
jgi:hypothetical protein